MVFKIILIGVGCVLLLLCFAFLHVSLCFSNKHTAKAKGFLCKNDYQKNVYVGMPAHLYKHWVKCSYKYVVDGKEYQISSENAGKPDQVLQSVTVIYQKKRPKYAYIKNMTIPIQPFISFAFFVLGTAFLVCGILYKL